MKVNLIKSSFYNEQETKDNLCAFIQWAQQLSMSQYCKKFEEMFAVRQWRKYCVFLNSGSSANLILIQSLLNLGRLQKGDKVAFSSLTWATNTMPLIQLWLVPIPVDVQLTTFNVSLSSFKKVVETNNIKALFITNLLGWCDDSFWEIYNYCVENNIIILEDNCESMWTVFAGKKLGNYSLASTFSTFVWHHMSTIEWGMVCTDDSDLYDMLVMVRAHGRDRNMNPERQQIIRQKNCINGFYSKYTFYTLWYNLRPNEITWFLWCEQLQYLDWTIKIRNDNAKLFIAAINKNTDFYQLKIDHIDLFSNFAIPMICKSSEKFEYYLKKFEQAWVEIRPIVWWDITQQLFWKSVYWEHKQETNAKLIHEQGFYFGNSPEYTEEEINLLLSLLN